jgi:tetratricopeptide (TPR) repeat protein
VAFHRLGFLGVPEFAPWLVAALLDTTVDVAEDLLESLVDVRLVEVAGNVAHSTWRYRMHDLVRLFAYERAVEEEAEESLRRAVARVVEVASDLVDQIGEHLPYAVPQLRRRPTRPTDPSILSELGSQPGWLEVEADCLILTVERAATLGLAAVACVLANALGFSLFAVHNNFSSWNRAHVAALAAARAKQHRAAEAVVVCGIALLRYKQDRFAESERNFETAVTLFDAAGDRHGAAAARSGLGNLFRTLGRHRDAVPLLENALATFERVGDQAAAAQAAYGLGYAYRELGRDPLSIRFLKRSAVVYRALRHWRGEAIAIRGVGLVHRARGELAEAETWLARAHDFVLGHGDRQLACYTAQSLAKLWIRQGDVERAREPLTSGVSTCRALDDRFGEALLLRTVGELHLAAGHAVAALRDLDDARTLWRTLGHELGAARTLRDIGAAHALAGDCPAAHEAWRSAWSTFARFGTRETTELAAWRRRSGCRCDAGLIDVGQPAHTGP